MAMTCYVCARPAGMRWGGIPYCPECAPKAKPEPPPLPYKTPPVFTWPGPMTSAPVRCKGLDYAGGKCPTDVPCELHACTQQKCNC